MVSLSPRGFAQSAGGSPDFGNNIFVFDPHMSQADMQAKIDDVYAKQQHSEFGAGRYAFLLKPGEYKLDIPGCRSRHW